MWVTPRFHKTSIWNIKEGDQIRFRGGMVAGRVEWMGVEEKPDGGTPSRVFVDLKQPGRTHRDAPKLRHHVLSELDGVEKRRLTAAEMLDPILFVPDASKGKRVGGRVKIETVEGVRYIFPRDTQIEHSYEMVTPEEAHQRPHITDNDRVIGAQIWAEWQPNVRSGVQPEVEPVYVYTERGHLVATAEAELMAEAAQSGPARNDGPDVYIAGFQIAITERGKSGWCIPSPGGQRPYEIQRERPAKPLFRDTAEVDAARDWLTANRPSARHWVEAEYAEEQTNRIVTKDLGIEF